MSECRIYLSGGMSGLSLEEQTKWRDKIINAIKFGDYEYRKNVSFFNPPTFFNYEVQKQKTEKEVMEYELNELRHSDLVVVNFNSPKSIGTAMELMCAYENRIPIVGLNIDNSELHPWLSEQCIRICDNIRELVEYIVNFYLQ